MQNTTNELSCGELANNQVNLEFNENTRQFVAHFRNMLLKNFKRIGKKSCEMVTDEKFGVVFKVSMDLCGQQFKENVLSTPIVVIVHGSQEINAIATVVWDNAFAKIDRQVFAVQDTVGWNDFAEALSYKFIASTGRGLTAENLHFLAEKLFDHRVPFPVPDKEYLVNWSAFCKERLPNRDFTFWEWFHAALKVTKEHLKNAFYEGRVVGFIDKKKTEELLYGSPHGTFILRFSDSELGGVSIAWVNNDEVDGIREPKVLHIQPINSKELEIIHINQRLNDVDELTYLHPNTPKAEAFRIDEEPFNPSDYITFRTVMRVNVNGRR
jgi:signal transducer and activator of transcription 5B